MTLRPASRPIRALSIFLLAASGCAPAAAPPTAPVAHEQLDAFASQARTVGVGPSLLIDLENGRRSEIASRAVARLVGRSEVYYDVGWSEVSVVGPVVDVDGTAYRLENSAYVADGRTIPFRNYLRQDRSGYFLRPWQSDDGGGDEFRTRLDADRSAGRVTLVRIEEARRSAGHSVTGVRGGRGPMEQELQLLPYPLHRNLSFRTRDGLVLTAEGRETIQTKVGPMDTWRFRIEVPAGQGYGTYEFNRVWWGPPGVVKREARYRIEERDGWEVPTGNLLDVEVTTELTSYGHGF